MPILDSAPAPWIGPDTLTNASPLTVSACPLLSTSPDTARTAPLLAVHACATCIVTGDATVAK